MKENVNFRSQIRCRFFSRLIGASRQSAARLYETAGAVLAKIKYHWKEREVQFQNK
jgi:hypothetical protein